MKVIILCGGLGTRLAEETQTRPKPMVEIGGRPIIWHIMSIYSQFGYNEFVLPLGYKAEYIKDYFVNYHTLSGDLRVDLSTGKAEYPNCNAENWLVDMYDTGVNSMTGGRLKRLEPYLRQEGTFMLTYGDGVADIDIASLLSFHKSHGGLATMTCVRPTARFGTMCFNGDKIAAFKEKAQTDAGWINGGFFVFEPEVFDYMSDDTTILEREPLEKLAEEGQLFSYKHDKFWQCMDTIRDKNYLNQIAQLGDVPWLDIKANNICAEEIV